ncbi:hypothetical protein Tco_0746849, partial [Tanacetum coccineum]
DDNVADLLIQVLKIHTDDNVADLLTKAFDVSQGLIAFRGSLRRVTNGTEALLILPLFILWLNKVSTDSAKLVPLGKVCTAIETLKKNTARALISLLTTISLSSTMAVLDSCPKHNMVAYLEKTEGNAEFHEIIDFLKRSSIHHALTVSPVVSTTFVERHLDAKKKFVMYPRFISILLDKQLANVSVPLDHFPINTLTSKVFSFMVKKGKHFSGKVTPLFATMLVQPTQDEGASSERPSEAQPTPSPAPTSEVPNEPQIDSSPAQTSEVPIKQQTDLSQDLHPLLLFLILSQKLLVSDQAKEIQHLKAQITKLKKQAKPVIKHHRAWLKSVSLKQRLARKRSSKKQRVHKESVSKQGRKFAKGESSVQRDPLFDEIPEDTVDHMKTENAQDEGRTRDIVNEDKEIEENVLSTEDVLSTDKDEVSTDKEKVSTDRPIVSTDGSKVSTDRQIEGTEEQIESTDGQRKGTEDHTEEGSATQVTQTPTSTIFGDDETIAKVSSSTDSSHSVSKKKEKGVELKDIEETDRPRPTSTRSLLTLRPLPKIDPKDKGKKKIEEEDETDSESDDIPQAEKKFKQLESDEEMLGKYKKIEERAKFLHDTIAAQENPAQQRSEAIRNRPPTKNQLRNQMMTYLKHVGNFKHAELKIKKFEEVQALYEKIKRSDEDFISIGSAEDERLIKRMNEKGVDSSKDQMVKEESKAEVQEESKEEESKRKRKLGTRKKMKSRKRRYIQHTSEDDSEKENDELRLHLSIAPDEEKEVDYEILDRKSPNHRMENRVVLSIFDREDLNAVYQLVMDRYQDKIPEGFDRVLWGDLMVMFNPDDENEFWNSQLDWIIVSWKLHSSSGLESEEDSTMALELIRFIKKLLAEHKNWLVYKQTACGKDFSNPFMVNNLPKIVGFSTHLASLVKSWLVQDQTVLALASPKANDKELSIPEQTATSKETSNPLMAGSLPKTTKRYC